MNCNAFGRRLDTHGHHINDRTIDVRNAINNCKHGQRGEQSAEGLMRVYCYKLGSGPSGAKSVHKKLVVTVLLSECSRFVIFVVFVYPIFAISLR